MHAFQCIVRTVRIGRIGRIGRLTSLVSIVAAAAALLPTTGAAQSAPYCDPAFPSALCLSGDQASIAPVRSTFRFQARVSRAKLPLGDATLPRVDVALYSGVTGEPALCLETLENVAVKDGVLNLEIGATDACPDLAYQIATRNQLQLQLCFESAGQCLDPIEITTVPYAIKANYAYAAQEADDAHEAYEAHYAHRMTADSDLRLADAQRTGYFDFTTPETAAGFDSLAGYGAAALVAPHNSGVVAWSPFSDAAGANVVNVCAADELNNGRLGRLAGFNIHSAKTEVRGDLTVTGKFTFNDGLNVLPQLTVGDATSPAGAKLLCNAHADFRGDVTVGDVDNKKHNVKVYPTAQFYGDVVTNGSVYSNGLLQVAGVTATTGAGVDLSRAGSVTLPADVVNTANIAGGAVTAGKLADNAVTWKHMAANRDTVGAGLINPNEGLGIHPSGGIAVNFDTVQRKVTGKCEWPQFVKGIDDKTNAVICADDRYSTVVDTNTHPNITADNGVVVIPYGGRPNDPTSLRSYIIGLETLFYARSYTMTQENKEDPQTLSTGIKANEWFCWVGSISVQKTDINEGKVHNEVFHANTYVSGGVWYIRAGIVWHETSKPALNVGVVCAKRFLVDNRGWGF